MLRFLLQFVLPLLVPLAVYVAYAIAMRGRSPGWLEKTPWLLLAGAGVGLLAVSLVSWGLLSGAPPEHTYQPARIEDGRIVPAQTVEP